MSVCWILSYLCVYSRKRHAAEIQTSSKELRTKQHRAAHALFVFLALCWLPSIWAGVGIVWQGQIRSPGDEAAPFWLTRFPTWCLPGKRHLQAIIVSSCSRYLRGLRRCDGARRWQKGHHAHGCGINPSWELWGAGRCSLGQGCERDIAVSRGFAWEYVCDPEGVLQAVLGVTLAEEQLRFLVILNFNNEVHLLAFIYVSSSTRILKYQYCINIHFGISEHEPPDTNLMQHIFPDSYRLD